MTIVDDLQRSLATGNVCAFVGAGLSVGAGLPGWYDLIAELSARIGHKLAPREWATGDALIEAAQVYVNRQGLFGLISHLKERLDTTGVQPTAAHRALAALPISLVFTANFDNLLERAFRDAGKRVEMVARDSSIPFLRRGPGVVNIVKLYGDLDQPDTIVLTRDQCGAYPMQRSHTIGLVQNALATSDMLYLGWGGADPDPYFDQLFGRLLSSFGQMMRPGYAVLFDVTGAQRDELRRKQIRLVELPTGDRTGQLAAWLAGLAPDRAALPVSGPEVVATSPRDGETGVDCGLTRLTLTFDRVMAQTSWSIRHRGGFVVGGQTPERSPDGKSLTFTRDFPGPLPPNTAFQLTFNSPDESGPGFTDLAGVSARPFDLHFTTGAAVQAPPRDRPAPSPAPPARRPPDLQLLIMLSADTKTLSFTLNSPDGDYNFLPVGATSLTASPRELLQRAFDRLSTWARLAPDARTPAQTAQAIREMADAGSNLYDELFPPEFKQEYPALREKHLGGNLLITSNEPWIPWEIVRPLAYDRRGQALYDDPPLCESYQLARWAAGAAAPAQLALNNAVVIQPAANLAAARSEREYFTALSAAGIAVALPLQSAADALASFSAGQTQLYHFACHGNFDLTDPNESRLKLADGFLLPSQLTGDRKSGLLRSRPVVFVNACHSGGRGFGLTRLGGWAERFVGAGASAFIGSLWEINDVLAARFASEFYNRIFGLDGHERLPLAAAFRAARLVLKELDPANPTWLAYVLYGNPRAELA